MLDRLRSGFFEQRDQHGVITEMPDRWRAVLAGTTGEADSPVAACVAATDDATALLLLLDITLSATEVEVSAAVQVPFVAGSPEINNAQLLSDQPESVTEHPDFEEVAQIFGPLPGTEYDDQGADGTNNSELYYLVGRLGHLFFKLDYGPVQWEFIGWYEEAREAADAVAFSGDGLSVEMLL